MNNSFSFNPFYHWDNDGGTAVVAPEEIEEEIAPVRVDETHSNSEDEITFADLGLSQVLLERIQVSGPHQGPRIPVGKLGRVAHDLDWKGVEPGAEQVQLMGCFEGGNER